MTSTLYVKVARGEFKFYHSGGTNIVYIDDVIQALLNVTHKGVPGRRYIICGDNLTFKDLFATIAHYAHQRPPHIGIPRWGAFTLGQLGDLSKFFGIPTSFSSEKALMSSCYTWYNGSRAQKELGIQPTPATIAIEESVQSMKNEGLLD